MSRACLDRPRRGRARRSPPFTRSTSTTRTRCPRWGATRPSRPIQPWLRERDSISRGPLRRLALRDREHGPRGEDGHRRRPARSSRGGPRSSSSGRRDARRLRRHAGLERAGHDRGGRRGPRARGGRAAARRRRGRRRRRRSTDGTAEILDRLDARPTRCVSSACERNRGHGPSVARRARAGAGASGSSSSTPTASSSSADFWRLWERREEADLVLGVRAARRDPAHRARALPRGIRDGRLALVAPPRARPERPVPARCDASSGTTCAPLARHGRARALDPRRASAPSRAAGASLEVPVTHLPRARGRSSLRAWRLVRFSARGLAQLVRFRLARRAGARGVGRT